MRALARLPASRPEDERPAWRPAPHRAAPTAVEAPRRLRAEPPLELTRAELAMLAKLEGEPMPRGQALADLLGVNPTAAWRLVRRLRRQGALRFLSAACVRPDCCQCITWLKVDWAATDSPDALDTWLRADPAIMTADRVTGTSDYRLLSRHAHYRAANAWARDLAAHPSVSRAVTRFCASLEDRPNYAAARLAADAREGEYGT